MAKQDKETYDSYEKDVYDNPGGTDGRSPWRAFRGVPGYAYVIVIIVALLAGLLFWGFILVRSATWRMPWSAQESSSYSTADKSG